MALKEAISHLQQLRAHDLQHQQPPIAGPSPALACSTSFDSNFEDRCAFVLGVSKYVEEAQSLATLNVILEQGLEHAGVVYTWRSSSRAIPQVKNDEQENRRDLYQSTVDVLGPQVAKLRELYQFQAVAIDRFLLEIKSLAHSEKLKGFISQTTKLTLAKMLDMLVVLDTLKNMKACLNNDFSFWKRANGFLQRGAAGSDPTAILEEREIALFLAMQNSITLKLQAGLAAIERADEVLAEIANECATTFETKQFVLAAEKHLLLKVAAFALSLMDGDTKKSKTATNLNKSKLVDLNRFDAMFKSLPIVPLFGDMQVAVMSFLKATPNYDPLRWPLSDTPEAVVRDGPFRINAHVDQFAAEHRILLSDLALLHAKTVNGAVANTTGLRASDVAIRGLRTIAHWTATVVELNAWKLSHPTDKYMNLACPDDADAYEKAMRYNYFADERSALIQIVSMIKSAAQALLAVEGPLTAAVRRDIHDDVQEFVQHALRDVIRNTTKKKKTKARTVLLGIRATCADWLGDVEPTDDPFMAGEKDLKYVPPESRSRQCGIGSTQLFMLRTMLESLCADEKKKSLKEEIDPKHHAVLEAFYARSFFFDHLLRFHEVLQQATDLSQFWYREFFLELSRGTRIQFPIDMSLPWILISHALSARDPGLIENVVYLLDLYNDSAAFALTHFRLQWLYDEVAAEVDLCIDQLIFGLSELVFAHYKTLAAAMLLDKDLDRQAAEHGLPPSFPDQARFAPLLRQRSVKVLGRSVNVQRLVSQRVNDSIRRAVDVAIARFESGNLSHVLELDGLVQQARLTHSLLAPLLALDPFADLFAEANESVTVPHGRITLHVFAELTTDVMPNWTYNNATRRFVLPEGVPVFGDGEPTRDAAPRPPPHFLSGTKALNAAYGAVAELARGFLGNEHFGAMARLLGYGGVAMCFDEMLKLVHHEIENTLTPYVTSLVEGMPKKCRLPAFEYGAMGALGFFQLQLKDIMSYRDLQTEVFHAFRQIGNAIATFFLLEEALTREEVLDLRQAFPFQGVVLAREGETKDPHAGTAMKLLSVAADHVDSKRLALYKDADLLTRERLHRGLGLFDAALLRIQRGLLAVDAANNHVWLGDPKSLDLDDARPFFRLWSAVNLTALFTAAASGRDATDVYFGDGLIWGGATLVSLLGQRMRFEALDFASHLISVYSTDPKDETLGGVSIPAFVHVAQAKRALHSQLFSVLDRFLSESDQTPPHFFPPAAPVIAPPPTLIAAAH